MTPTEWFVAFEPKTSIWWGRFLEPGFGHCFAFGFVASEGGGGTWVSVEALTTGVKIGVQPGEAVARWMADARLGRLRLLRVRPPENEVVRPRLVVTCAGAIGAVLGLRRLPLTPRGLWWMLRRLGTTEAGR